MATPNDIKYLSVQLVDVLSTTCTDMKVLEKVKQALNDQAIPSDSESIFIFNYVNRAITLRILELKGYTELTELVHTDPGEFEKALLMLAKATEQLTFGEKYIPEIIEKHLEQIHAQREQLNELQKELDSKLYKDCMQKVCLMEDSCKLAKTRYEEKHNN